VNKTHANKLGKTPIEMRGKYDLLVLLEAFHSKPQVPSPITQTPITDLESVSVQSCQGTGFYRLLYGAHAKLQSAFRVRHLSS
jgi:hypothetical protein